MHGVMQEQTTITPAKTTSKMQDILNIAHRGASAYAPENTFAAFDRALELNVSHVEMDVHLTRDGHIVVIHDDRVDRTTDGTGSVAERTLAELRALDAGSWFGAKFTGERIPTLDEVLQRYKDRLYLHIEIKARPAATGLASRTVDLVRRHGVSDSVTIISFWRRPGPMRPRFPPAGWCHGDPAASGTRLSWISRWRWASRRCARERTWSRRG